jgi:hypothetical protein
LGFLFFFKKIFPREDDAAACGRMDEVGPIELEHILLLLFGCVSK